MELVILTALGVGGATVLGAVIGFVFKNISQKYADTVLSFAAGVMLAASILALILPSLDGGGQFGLFITITGIFSGALCLGPLDKAIPHVQKHIGADIASEHRADACRVLLFVAAIAIHNLPEGIAAGVGAGSGDLSRSLLIVGAIALQNIPEGTVIIAPMLAAGYSPKKTFACAALTGLIEVIGTLIGYFAVTVATAILPFSLAFAGGSMLYVIVSEMLPETHGHGATYAFLVGFCIVMVTNVLTGG